MHRCLSIPELIISIAEMLDDRRDLSHLTRCCHAYREVVAPLLLRDIDVPLEKIEKVLAFSSTVPSFACRHLKISEAISKETREALSRVSSRFAQADLSLSLHDSWRRSLASLLEIIGRQGTLVQLAWYRIEHSPLLGSIWDALSTSSVSLQTLCLDSIMDQRQGPAISLESFPRGQFFVLRRLTVSGETKGRWDLLWLDRMLEASPKLETLIISFHEPHNLNLTSSHPRLRVLQVSCGLNSDMPRLEGFLHRHPSIERLSIARAMSAIQPRDLPNLKALAIDQSTVSFPPNSDHLWDNVRHLRCFNPPDMRGQWIIDHLASSAALLTCLELVWTERRISNTHGVLTLPLLVPNLRELGLRLSMDRTGVRPMLRDLLAAFCSSELLVVRIQTEQMTAPSRGSPILIPYLRSVPPNFRYIVWDGSNRRNYYALATGLDERTFAVKVNPPSLREELPDDFSWTTDSVFDHLAVDPGY